MLPLYEDKSEENQIYLETVAEFMHTLIQSHSLRVEIMKSMRKNIKDIYDGNVSVYSHRTSSSAPRPPSTTGRTSSTA